MDNRFAVSRRSAVLGILALTACVASSGPQIDSSVCVSFLETNTTLARVLRETKQASCETLVASQETIRRLDLSRESNLDPRVLDIFTELRELDVSDTHLANLDFIASHPTLETLLASNNLVVRLPEGLPNSLKHLDVATNRLTGVALVTKLKQLEHLDVSFNKLKVAPELCELTSLRELALEHNRIVDLSPLACLRNLRSLWLADNRIVDLAPLQSLTELRLLQVRGNRIRDLEPLRQMGNLEELVAGHNRITSVKPLEKLSKLSRISLEWNKIGDFSPLSRLPGSTSANLFGNPGKVSP